MLLEGPGVRCDDARARGVLTVMFVPRHYVSLTLVTSVLQPGSPPASSKPPGLASIACYSLCRCSPLALHVIPVQVQVLVVRVFVLVVVCV